MGTRGEGRPTERHATEDGYWMRGCVLLTLKVGRTVVAQTGDDMLLAYYGPPEWKALVDAEEPRTGGELLQEVHAARETLGRQGFEPGRASYLGKHLRALETVARRFSGEDLPLEEQATGCFDLDVGWAPESAFEEARELYDEGLPGAGGVGERLRRWKQHHELSGEKARLLPVLVERAVQEARKRTDSLIRLPEGDEVSFGTVTGQLFSAVAEYRGSLRSRVLVNTDTMFNAAELLYVACHEGYPGHLAEIVLKEQRLAKEKGYVEQLVSFLPTPRCVVSEGLALWAREVAFPGGEEQDWLEEHAYPEVGIRPDGCDLSKIHAAKDLLWGAWCNAAFMLREGRSPEEVARYVAHWTLLDEGEAHQKLPSLGRPFAEAYIFCYHHGRKLLEPGMRGPDRDDFVRSLLTRQVLPSDLERRGPEPTLA